MKPFSMILLPNTFVSYMIHTIDQTPAPYFVSFNSFGRVADLF